MADPERYDTIIITNLCVPTASGVPLDLLPDQINGVRIVGIDVPGFGVPTHAEAKDVLAGAMLKYARTEVEQGPVAAPATREKELPTVTLLGELFPADPVVISQLLAPMGLAVGPTVPTREWRELYTALDCAAVAAIHPFYTASVREFERAGRPVVGSAPVGVEGTASWLEAIGKACGVDAALIEAAKEASVPCPKTAWSANDLAWLEARGVEVKFRASLEDDLAAFEHYKPDLAIGTTPLVQAAKAKATPALYFTNLISARPLMGAAGAGSVAQVMNAALENKDRFDKMNEFFEGVGEGDTSGIWQDTPMQRPAFREQFAKKLAKQAAARASTATS